MIIGDKVFVIPRKEFGKIEAIKRDAYSHTAVAYFVSFEGGLGFWFRRNEITEG
jgi:hypothetical protein